MEKTGYATNQFTSETTSVPSRQVILVDSYGNDIGSCEKLDAHRRGLLHRAFSVFLFNDSSQLLLQKRATEKYHSAGLWSNTCCSHPNPGEETLAAAQRRLGEEMGLTCDLKEICSITYRVKLGHLIEHEYDHVYFGKCNEDPRPDPKEVESYKWTTLDSLRVAMEARPNEFTYWLKVIVTEKWSTLKVDLPG